MTFYERITGRDMTVKMKSFESRVRKLPGEYSAAWDEIKSNLMQYSDFSGRNLMPVFDGVVGLLEESAGDGQSINEVLGDDIKGFCHALAGEDGSGSFRDKWRRQLNETVAKKLGK